MLKLRYSDRESLRLHAEEAYPYECCGILLGKVEDDTRIVEETVRCHNTRTDSPKDRYEIDPAEVARILRDARTRGLDIIGFYHSHPNHTALWSRTDLEEAYWLGCSYVITSVAKGKAQITRSYALTGGSLAAKAFVAEKIIADF
jgi:proteasome lid subunit RPN8/RPN11